mgnify:CR=1 FL=1
MISTAFYNINVLAAGYATRKKITDETGVTINILDKVGSTNGSTMFNMKLRGEKAQIDEALLMFEDAIARMRHWAAQRRLKRAQNRRVNGPRGHQTRKTVANPETTKTINPFAGLEVEEIKDPMPVVPQPKLSKKQRQQRNKRFIPLVMTDSKLVMNTTNTALPTAPKLSWGDVLDEDSGDDNEDDDGFTLVRA